MQTLVATEHLASTVALATISPVKTSTAAVSVIGSKARADLVRASFDATFAL
ncbi:MAG: hypothetical protein AB7E55_08840 [Pigmentiphaga sp.]